MVRRLIFVLFVVAVAGLSAFSIPVSSVPILGEDNMITGLVRVSPDDSKPDPLGTRCWLWQDGDYLVAYLEATIDSTFEKGSVSMRDDGSHSDNLRLQLITVPQAYYAYYYVVYPMGNIVDAVRDKDHNMDYSWNSRMISESKIESDVWKVTMRIPLDELRFDRALPYRWKVIVTRYLLKTQDSYSYPYCHTKQGLDYFTRGQDVSITQAVKRTLDISFRPYLVGSLDFEHAPNDPMASSNLGIDVAFNPAQRTRIKLSLNPDFSDVPPDNIADTYNSKYPPYLSESRFFFTEDIDAFGLDDEMLYTRNIAKPRIALKATGNSGGLNWGALAAWDKEILDYGMVINPDDYFQVLAANWSTRKDYLHNALISRMNGGYYNHYYVGAYKREVLKNVYVSPGWAVSTRKNESEGDVEAMLGYISSLRFIAKPGDFYASMALGKVNKDFRADSGYFWDTDYEQISGECSWSKELVDRFVSSINLSMWGGMSRNNVSSDPILTYNEGGNIYFGFRPKFNINAYAVHNHTLDLANNPHDVVSGSMSFNIYRWQQFGCSITYAPGQELIYKLYDTYFRHTVGWYVWGSLFKGLDYSSNISWRRYNYPRTSIVVVDDEPQTVNLDNEYCVGNASLSYTPSVRLRFKAGAGLSTYQSSVREADLSVFGNIRYEFRPECFLYTGFSTDQWLLDDDFQNNASRSYQRRSASFYMKVSIAS